MKSRSRAVANCEVCNLSEFTNVFEQSENSNAVSLCDSCGLLFSNPTLEILDLQDFYDDEFTGDAGGGNSRKKQIEFEDALRKVNRKIIPFVSRFFSSFDGLNIVEFRSRQGALAVALQNKGANVRATDPMLPNVLRGTQNGASMEQLKVFEHSTLSNFPSGYFDAAICLTIHVLAHLPEPSKFLSRLYDILKPGALLFVDEKNVLKPEKITANNIFDSGIGHFYHFTPDTILSLIKSSGFEIVENDCDLQRKSSFQHMRVVARKPHGSNPQQIEFKKIDKNRLLNNILRANEKIKRIVWKNRILQVWKTFAK
jgi:SAM-dependent methyltransferase